MYLCLYLHDYTWIRDFIYSTNVPELQYCSITHSRPCTVFQRVNIIASIQMYSIQIISRISAHACQNTVVQYPCNSSLSSSIKDQCLYLLRQYINIFHIIQSLLHVVQVGYGYILMLVAMTYNGWLFLAVCFGAGLGYFIFARCKSSSEREQNEHCN